MPGPWGSPAPRGSAAQPAAQPFSAARRPGGRRARPARAGAHRPTGCRSRARNRAVTCFSTAASLTCSASAMPELDRPSAMAARTPSWPADSALSGSSAHLPAQQPGHHLRVEDAAARRHPRQGVDDVVEGGHPVREQVAHALGAVADELPGPPPGRSGGTARARRSGQPPADLHRGDHGCRGPSPRAVRTSTSTTSGRCASAARSRSSRPGDPGHHVQARVAQQPGHAAREHLVVVAEQDPQGGSVRQSGEQRSRAASEVARWSVPLRIAPAGTEKKGQPRRPPIGQRDQSTAGSLVSAAPPP